MIAGGKSNLTYEVTDGQASWIVRRPPLGHVLATAHDMSREYRVITALQATDVPVPATYALCEDIDVIGAPFFVMERVEGTPYRTCLPARAAWARAYRRPRRADGGHPGRLAPGRPRGGRAQRLRSARGFLARQVQRWKKQLDASRSRDLTGADELHHLLEAHLPVEGAPAVVHGDFRLDNLLVDADDQVAAVIDWEMATIGDPLTDVALLLVYQRMADARHRLCGRGCLHGAGLPHRSGGAQPVCRPQRKGPVGDRLLPRAGVASSWP